LDRLYEEIAYIAYHFHWSRDEIMGIPHKERHRWVKEISESNKKINKAAEPEPAPMAASLGGTDGFAFSVKDKALQEIKSQLKKQQGQA
jgi:hypothetical protein